MSKKNLLGYLRGLNIDQSAKETIAAIIIYGDTAVKQLRYNQLVCDFKNYEIDGNFKISKDVVGIMEVVNRMVKDKKCPRNLRNRFYGKKTMVIEELIREGRCSEFYKEGYCYSLLVDGKYRFHQLKETHPTWEKDKYFFDGEREYVPGTPLPFNKDTYREFMLASALYLGQRRKRMIDMLPQAKK